MFWGGCHHTFRVRACARVRVHVRANEHACVHAVVRVCAEAGGWVHVGV